MERGEVEPITARGGRYELIFNLGSYFPENEVISRE